MTRDHGGYIWMKRKAVNGIKYWGQLLLLPVYWLSFLMPRDKNIWLFGSTFGRRFSENPRYLYLYACQHQAENGLRPIWISHNKEVTRFLNANGYEAYDYHSLKGIWYALRAKVYIFDNYSKDINFWQSGGAVKVNLWHGSGNKRTNYDNRFDTVRHPKNLWERWKTFPRRLSDEKPDHYTLATSPAMKEIFVSAFHTDEKHIIVEGYPRNDILFPFEECQIRNLYTKEERELLKLISARRKSGDRILTYMPTFRDSETKLLTVLNPAALDRFLEKEKLFLVMKLHPKSKIKKELEKLHYRNIVNADAEIDVYSFLGESDLLITDYSSVYTDFMLLDRPVLAFCYDWEEYTEHTRECYIDQDEYMPERKATTMEELMEGICEVLKEDTHKEQRHVSRRRMFAKTDGRSCERLIRKIKAIRK